jgi:hypothetical protein
LTVILQQHNNFSYQKFMVKPALIILWLVVPIAAVHFCFGSRQSLPEAAMQSRILQRLGADSNLSCTSWRSQSAAAAAARTCVLPQDPQHGAGRSSRCQQTAADPVLALSHTLLLLPLMLQDPLNAVQDSPAIVKRWQPTLCLL